MFDAVDVAGLPPEWQYAGWGTIHYCVKGKTLRAPRRLYIVDHQLEGWLSNAVYTTYRWLYHASGNPIRAEHPPD